MTTPVNWETPIYEGAYTGAGLNSKANASSSGLITFADFTGGTAVVQSTARKLYARLTLDLASITPTAGASITARLIPRDPQGAWDADQIASNYDIGTLAVSTTTGVKRLVWRRFQLDPFDDKFELVFNLGTSTAASGNTLRLYVHSEEI
jgi:hypothetical protein